MTALTEVRQTSRREGVMRADPAAAGVTCYEGGVVCLDAAGDAVPATTAGGLTARGISLNTVDNSAGAAGDELVEVETGEFLLDNDAGDPIDRSHIDGYAYLVDDQTVAATDDGGARSIAGRITDVDAGGVWVEFA